jgi:hypothetical protein
MTTDQIRLVRWAIADALQAASSIAGRAAEHFEGTDAAALFADLRNEILNLRTESPAMRAISSLTHRKK